jgi:RHS repeat-associated protein
MNGAGKAEANRVNGNGQPATSPPAISLPKGGGAIRGMGEKFAANPVTGTGSMTVPIATSPGRSGFGPQLSLSYDSGAGNGPYGFGWSLSLPSITRKTDKGLPKYEDADESDVFILSGAEDLVRVLTQQAGGQWKPEVIPPRKVNGMMYRIERYRPRIEGLFARIERWTNTTDTTEVFWRSISRDNITTWYGKTEESRIANPEDPSQIFSWLICQSYDDKGNAIVYKYQSEDSQRIFEDQQGQLVALAHESNRTDATRSTNRYLKRIKYGNRQPNRDAEWNAADPAKLPGDTWMFEVVFDYGEGHYTEEAPDSDQQIFAQPQIKVTAGSHWRVRQDPFSTYRSGFEVRTYRLCQRVLMFHHFPDPEELATADYLVRSTEFTYSQSPIASFITSVTQSGYVRRPSPDQPNRYLKKSLPPLAFEYSQAIISEEVHDVDPKSLEDLPVGADGAGYQWLDLDGEGLQCVLAELGDGWYYKRNVSPLSFKFEDGKPTSTARFDPVTEVATLPSFAETLGQRHQFLDLAGDGQLDCVVLERPVAGFFERTHAQNWEPFKPLPSLPNLDWSEPNLRFIDLTGDGHADILITEDDVLTWYRSMGEEGFGPAERVPQSSEEEKGPRLVFANGEQSIYLADLSGDGLTDIVRIRNGEVCYWPNLGYGRFGAKVTMDNAPWFDAPDQFDQKRIRLADIDGSGTTDIIYLHRDGVDIYRNQCGNGWSDVERLSNLPVVNNVSSIQALDLLGNGTACLVWSSPLPGDVGRSMRYIDLMGGQKPHLLIKTANNLGAETVIRYAPSTKFYLDDKQKGRPWRTKLPFPVHCVERVETLDFTSRNRFVTRIVPHQGFYDPFEREFRGFGMVEQFDTEELAALTESGDFPDADNIDAASYVPTVLTKTWFHTGAYIEGSRISRQFEDEYYHEGDESEGFSGLTDEQLETMLLPDTKLPTTFKRQDESSIAWELTGEEMREACRALKGAVLRREVYALDGTDEEDRPYSTTEQNYTVELLQPQGDDKHAVFFTHPRESIDFHYERKLVDVGGAKRADPCVTHAMILEVDGYGNVLKSAAIGYGRRPGLSPLQGNDKKKQEQLLITYTENAVTDPIDQVDDYRTPLAWEGRTYELLKIVPDSSLPAITNLFGFEEMVGKAGQASDGSHDLPYEDIDAIGATTNHPYRRLIEHVRTLYRRNNLSGPLPLRKLDSLAIPFESYKLAFTPDLLAKVYSTKVTDSVLDEGGYVHSEGDKQWWIPSGKVFFDINADIASPANTAPQELAEARAHFFLPRKFGDPFNQSTTVNYDVHDLLTVETRDPLGNLVTVRTKDDNGSIAIRNDYRVLQPYWVTDPNRNRARVVFDALGMVVATAVMGKATGTPGEKLGDLLDDAFEPDPTQAQLDAFVAKPREASANAYESVATQSVHKLLGTATTRIVYDLDRFKRLGEPPFAATLARETHVSDLTDDQQTKIQIRFSYSDGFGREIQSKIQAEAVVDGGSILNPRWVGSGWTVFNNKGKPVRQYEPFFSDTHRFEFNVKIGVSPILFYDPVERVVATLYPNHTYEKVVLDPWQQKTYDVNDTIAANGTESGDPRIDVDIESFVARYFEKLPASPPASPWLTWHAERIGGAMGEAEQQAAEKAAAHANTPTIAYFDTLGRTFLTIAYNRFERNNAIVEEKYPTRVELDIEGNQRAVRDPVAQNNDTQGRIVMRYDYDMLGNRIHQTSMEAGERWMLNDVSGKPIRAWDSRGFARRLTYDELRRPVGVFVTGSGLNGVLAEKTVYGDTPLEGPQSPETTNHRGKVYQFQDGAGRLTSEEYDYKGNLLRSTRQLVQNYKTALDWSANPALEQEPFTNSTTYDALDRPIAIMTPDNSTYHPTFSEANLLDKVDVNLRGAATATAFVTNIDHDAKGQRKLIAYGNGARTAYEYDPLTFRLTRLKTTRPVGMNGLSQLFINTTVVQDLHYIYDPVGNITRMADTSLARLSSTGPEDNAPCDYIYDAIYRLIESTGREHIGQTAHNFSPPDGNRRDWPFFGSHAHPNDLQAMRRYWEQYEHDAVGNFMTMRHIANGGGWIRDYDYNAASLLEPTKTSNRLTKTTVGNGVNFPEDYAYTDAQDNDVDGCMTSINSMKMEWDFKDQLQKVHLGGGGTVYYVYDGGGQRVRKVWEKAPGLTEERIYLGGFEVFRKHGGPIGANTVTLQRDTLHVMNNEQRIALVERRTLGSDPAPEQLIRYQFSNHLGSASLELDDQAQIISYEEYTPYGSTSYQAVRSQTETSKRYRYTGKERDEETGFTYHGARYYAAWLGRWTSTDPLGLKDGMNMYVHVRGNPVNLVDPNGLEGKGFWEGVQENLYRRGEAMVKSVPTIWRGGTLLSFPVSTPGLVVAVATHPEGFSGVVKDAGKTVGMAVTAPIAIVKSTGEAFGTLVYGAVNPSKVTPSQMGSAATDAILGIADIASVAPKKPAAKLNAVSQETKAAAASAKSRAAVQTAKTPPPHEVPPPSGATKSGAAEVGASAGAEEYMASKTPTGTPNRAEYVPPREPPKSPLTYEIGPSVVIGGPIETEGVLFHGRLIIAVEGETYYKSRLGTDGKWAGAWYRFYGVADSPPSWLNAKGKGPWIGKWLPGDRALYRRPDLAGTKVRESVEMRTPAEVNKWLESRGVHLRYGVEEEITKPDLPRIR